MLRERLGIKVLSVTQPMGEDPSDHSAFLAESIHEMFDEYYSVSFSFWTRTGLREKARQGHLVGSLPWGYRGDPETALAMPDPERAPLVRELFERYAGGQESDRSLAAWLNSLGRDFPLARSPRRRQRAQRRERRGACSPDRAGWSKFTDEPCEQGGGAGSEVVQADGVLGAVLTPEEPGVVGPVEPL